MHEFIEVPYQGDFKAAVVEKHRDLPASIKSKIDEIWDKEFQQRQGKLFNGTVLGIVEAGVDEILVERAEYKLVLARVRDASLAKAIDFKPLGTSGMTLSNGKVLIGQRSPYVSTSPHAYEMVPSGSVDCSSEDLIVDLKKQLLLELDEEAEIASSYVEQTEGWTLIYDVETKMYEVVARIHVQPFFSSSPIHQSTGEYTSLLWLSSDELEKHLIQHSDHYVPLTKHLYTKWKEFI